MLKHHSIYQAMISAAGQTFENMAFTEVMEHFDPSYEIPADDLAWTSILIHDPVQAEIRLAMPRSLMKNLTSNIFSIAEEEVTEIQMQDILYELLNTIAGLFMTDLLDDNQVYQLGLPEAGDGELPPVDADTLVWKLMTSDESPLQIYAVGASLLVFSEQ